jgi:plasmid stabilization system protein ParE
MTKPFRVADAIADVDLPAIVAYHRQRSVPKAERILAEYDSIVALLSENPRLMPERSHGWRVYPFESGTYVLYYRELDAFWLAGGVFHALREPNWILAQAVLREVTNLQ